VLTEFVLHLEDVVLVGKTDLSCYHLLVVEVLLIHLSIGGIFEFDELPDRVPVTDGEQLGHDVRALLYEFDRFCNCERLDILQIGLVHILDGLLLLLKLLLNLGSYCKVSDSTLPLPETTATASHC